MSPSAHAAAGKMTSQDIRRSRTDAGWTIAEAARRLKERAGPHVPEIDSLIRSWKRWEAGTTPSRQYHALLADVLGLASHHVASPRTEILRVFSNQAGAADEIRSMAAAAHAIDLLVVRGLGLIAMNDSLLRPIISVPREVPLRLRVVMARPRTRSAARRAHEIGEATLSFNTSLDLVVTRLAELAALDHVTCEAYQHSDLPVWRLIGIDDTLFVSTYAEEWEGHMSANYKMAPTGGGPSALHGGFQRTYEALCVDATRVI